LRISRRFPLNPVPRIVSTWVRETGYYARTDRVPNPREDDGIVFGERARLDVLAQVSRIVADPACAVAFGKLGKGLPSQLPEHLSRRLTTKNE
jgi:hypothetical protein